MEPTDAYKTITAAVSGILSKEKKSKFYGYAYRISHEDEVKPLIESLRKIHPSANHVCYAWQLGVDTPYYRANDDGEPNNSAGMPIYGQIQSFEITNVLVAVVRVFGGTKLGVGGLISAYRESARLTLESAKIITQVLKEELLLSFEYAEMDSVMRLIKKNQLELISQELELTCEIALAIRKTEVKKILKELKALHKVKIKKRA